MEYVVFSLYFFLRGDYWGGLGVKVSQLKPSHCFRRLEKLVLPSTFDTSLVLMMRNSQSYPTTVFNERMRHLGGGSKHTLTPPTYFQRVKTPIPKIYALAPPPRGAMGATGPYTGAPVAYTDLSGDDGRQPALTAMRRAAVSRCGRCPMSLMMTTMMMMLMMTVTTTSGRHRGRCVRAAAAVVARGDGGVRTGGTVRTARLGVVRR